MPEFRSAVTISRLWLYRFLARCYGYPGPTLVQGLRQARLWDRLAESGEVLGRNVHRNVERLRCFAGCDIDDQDRLLMDLQVEYTFLFINAVPRLPAPPYESVYSGEGLLMGEPVSQVLRAYRQAGLIMDDDFDGLPDHIAAELAFESHLIHQEVTSRGEAPQVGQWWRARQREFMADHLLGWGPPFLARVRDHARHPFYLRVAGLTGALLAFEKEWLGLT